MWKERDKSGEASRPEDDMGIADRQAEDRVRAEANAPNRQRREWADQGRGRQGDNPEPVIAINATGKWSGRQCRGEENKERDEREKYILGELAEAGAEKRRGAKTSDETGRKPVMNRDKKKRPHREHIRSRWKEENTEDQKKKTMPLQNMR